MRPCRCRSIRRSSSARIRSIHSNSLSSESGSSSGSGIVAGSPRTGITRWITGIGESVAEHQQPGRPDEPLHLEQDTGGGAAVDDAMIEGDGHESHLADHDLAVADDRLVDDLVDAD